MRKPTPTTLSIMNRLLFLTTIISLSSCQPSNTDWPEYHADASRSHYSPLNQVSAKNLSKLKVAWTYSSVGAGDTLRGTQMQCNPIVIDGVMYGVSALNQVFAVNAETGVELWKTNISDNDGTTSRGVAYYAAQNT